MSGSRNSIFAINQDRVDNNEDAAKTQVDKTVTVPGPYNN